MAGTTSDDIMGLPGANDMLHERQIHTLYDALEADNIEFAVKVIGFMGDSKNVRAVGPLTVLLEYPDEAIQAQSAITLGRVGDKAAIQPLVDALGKTSDKVKISIVTALGMFGDRRVIGAIEGIPLTPDEPKLINAVRSTIFKLDHPDRAEYFPPDSTEEGPQESYEAPLANMKTVDDITVTPPEDKNPLLSAVLSLFVPGLGQVYNGEGYVKGVLYLFGAYLGLIFLVFPGLLVWMYCIYSAYTTAQKINDGIAGSDAPTMLGMVAFALFGLIILPAIFALILSLIITILIFGMAR